MKYGIYQHYKGQYYRVLFLGRDADTLEETVIYQGLYTNEFGVNPIWTRNKKEFEKPLEDQRIRFQYLGPFPQALESIKDKL